MPSPSAASPETGRSSAVAGLLREATRLDRTQSDPAVALRNAVGIAAPLAIGAITGNAAIGLASTVGALQTAFADRPGPYRLRIVRMLGTALAAAITTTLAVLASRSDAGSVLLLLVLAFGAGLLLTAGPSATQVGIASVGSALVLGHIPQPAPVAVHVGLLVLAGGAGQTVLAVLGWPLRRHRPERLALAGLYRELAAAARSTEGSRTGPPASDTLTAVRQTLYGLGHDHGPSVEAYRVLLDEAARVRRELVTLTAAAERLAIDRNPILAGLVRGALGAAADVLTEIADSLAEARPVVADVLDRARTQLRRTIDRLESAVDSPAELTRRATAARLRALSGQLRAVVESTETGASEGRREDDRRGGTRGLRDPLAVLRANLAPDSAVLRHAVRLAVLVAGSDLVVRLIGYDRGYWVSLTLLVVLRPDFGATLQRAVMRSVGTIVGLLIATGLVHWLPGGGWWSVGLIAVFAFGMRLAGPGNVALSAVGLSGLVVVLLAINGIPAHTAVDNRMAATAIGAVLAIVATLALPSWERRYVPARLADLLDAYRVYLVAVADPHAQRDTLIRDRAAARRARTNAQASVDRAQAEPVPARAEVELGRTVLAHTHRFIHATMVIDSVRGQLHEADGPPELTAFLEAAVTVLGSTRDTVASGRAPAGLPRLRPLQTDLAERLTAEPQLLGEAELATTVIDATDRITNSLDTLVEQLRAGTARIDPGTGQSSVMTT